MKIKFLAGLKIESALAVAEKNPDAMKYAPEQVWSEPVALAVAEKNPDAMQYIKSKDLFISVAAKLNIEIEI